MQIYDKNEIPDGYIPKSRAVYIILAIFFYGLGIHEFYRGDNRTGIGFLLLSLVGHLWFWGGLIDDGSIYFFPLIIFVALFITMLVSVVKKDRDANGVLMK